MIKVGGGQHVTLGFYLDEVEAARAWDTAAVFFRGR
jgi:hypothetical protein